MGLSSLPPLRRFSKNRNSPWSFRGHVLYCISRTILNRTNPNPEAKENMFLLPKLLFPPKQTTTALGNHSHKSQFSRTWSLLKEPSVLSLATRKHLPVLPTVTYTVLTRCSESDPVTESQILFDSKVIHQTPTHLTSCQNVYFDHFCESFTSHLFKEYQHFQVTKIIIGNFHECAWKLEKIKSWRRKWKNSLHTSKRDFIFYLLDW